MAAEAQSLGQGALAEQLRTRSLIGGAVAGIVVVAGIPVLLVDDRVLVDGLVGRALPLVLVSGLAGLLTMRLLQQRKLSQARISAALAVAAVILGWGVAQYPWLLVDEVTIADGAGAPATLIGLLAASVLALVVVIPPLVYLFILAERNQVGSAPTQSAETGLAGKDQVTLD